MPVPAGSQFPTLRDAANYTTAHGGLTMFTRIGMMGALYLNRQNFSA